ncbi:unnamed protein product [Arabidopsis halleri]
MVFKKTVVRRSPRLKTASKSPSKSAPKSTKSVVIADSAPISPPVVISSTSGASRVAAMPEVTDPGQSPLFMHSSDHPGSTYASNLIQSISRSCVLT